MTLSKMELVLDHAPTLRFVNSVRRYLGQTELLTMPLVTMDYGTQDCPIAAAIGNCRVVAGTIVVNPGQTRTAQAIASALNASGRFDQFGEISFNTPESITGFVVTIDSERDRFTNEQEEAKNAVYEAQDALYTAQAEVEAAEYALAQVDSSPLLTPPVSPLGYDYSAVKSSDHFWSNQYAPKQSDSFADQLIAF